MSKYTQKERGVILAIWITLLLSVCLMVIYSQKSNVPTPPATAVEDKYLVQCFSGDSAFFSDVVTKINLRFGNGSWTAIVNETPIYLMGNCKAQVINK